MRLWLIAVLVLVVGCATPLEAPETQVEPIKPAIRLTHLTGFPMSVDLADMMRLWVREVGTRYDDAFIVMVHGSTVKGEWWASPSLSSKVPMQVLVDRLRRRIGPDRRIVLVSCNKGGHALIGENVSYATNVVWAVPDSGLFTPIRPHVRDELWPDIVGSISEFVEQ